MNEIFKPYLRKFTLAFFDDIMVYNKSVAEHLMHLKMVLQTMQAHTLFPKRGNYTFAVSQVEYLGHIISDKGVATYLAKIEAMKDWHVPKNVKQLRGFFRLTSYYKRFIKGYAIISKPLTTLLKKNSFEWFGIAQEAFEKLKNVMVQAHVLGLPNFKKEFNVENDSCGTGISVVLQQDGRTLAYLSKALSPRHQAMSTYEKEFLAVILALKNRKGYLMDRHFKIKTNHFNLKYLLDQRLTTPFQAKWLPTLLGYDYEIAYKKGSENVVVDALSKKKCMVSCLL
ncbi:putative mitochondrial protein [Tanacetum coccineum]